MSLESIDFKQALKLLHSTEPNSAERIRNALDELIKARHGPSKMLANTLSSKYFIEEMNAPGVIQKPVKPPTSSITSKNPSSHSSNASPVEGVDNDAIMTDLEAKENEDDGSRIMMPEDQLRELEDLMCVECQRMDVTAGNALVECTDCHSLYHQECHKPNISDSEANDSEISWVCFSCKVKNTKLPTAITDSPSAKPSSPMSSSSSTASSTNYQKSVSNSKHHESSSSSSRKSKSPSKSSHHHHKHKHSPSSSSSSSPGSSKSNSTLPHLNTRIISADKRLQIMKKKAAKQQESKRKHK